MNRSPGGVMTALPEDVVTALPGNAVRTAGDAPEVTVPPLGEDPVGTRNRMTPRTATSDITSMTASAAPGARRGVARSRLDGCMAVRGFRRWSCGDVTLAPGEKSWWVGAG